MRFSDFIKDEIAILDGAVGTMLQKLNLKAENYGGAPFSTFADILCFSCPDEIKKIHMQYLCAGAHGIETNTFGSSFLRLLDYDLKNLEVQSFQNFPVKNKEDYKEFSYLLNLHSAQIAKNAIDEYKSDDSYDKRHLFVLGSIGPSNFTLSPSGANLKKGSWDEIVENFYVQSKGLIDGGVDVLLFETQQDILELKAAIMGAKKAISESQKDIDIICQVTVDEFSRMQIFGTKIESAITTITDLGIDVFGINCSLGPDLMEDTIKRISRRSHLPISVLPNAGMPLYDKNNQVYYNLSPDVFTKYLKKFVCEYGVNIVGGCCGTDPSHIEVLSKSLKGIKPIKRQIEKKDYISGLQEEILLNSSDSLIKIGERVNLRGSKKIKDAVENRDVIDFDILEEVANEQINDFALNIIDVCMDSNILDTKELLQKTIAHLATDFKGAMCIDSFDPESLIESLKVYPGKPIINSVSLEDYKKDVRKCDFVFSKTKFHAPYYIALLADNNGPAKSKEEKVDLACQIIKRAKKFDVSENQLFIDLGIFPIGSEQKDEENYAKESLEAISPIKALHPSIKTIVGISNLTNGLSKKPYMRIVLSSVFLDEAKKRGLDAAIMNPAHYVPVESLNADDYALAKKIIFNKDMDAFFKLEKIAENKTNKKTVKQDNYKDLSFEKRVALKIENAFKEKTKGQISFKGFDFHYEDKIVLDIKDALESIEPLDFINLHLMPAMEKIGEKFSNGDISLPHLLKSADLMKCAMDFIEGYMSYQKGDAFKKKKGKIVLGTVFQDVHSIGKDLVKALLENYGYEVVDLGVQASNEAFLNACIEHKADAIGMSALLVQTAHHMKEVAKLLSKNKIKIPILIGGAPVNNNFALEIESQTNHTVFYCKSAMDAVNALELFFSGKKEKSILDNKDKFVEIKHDIRSSSNRDEYKEHIVDFEKLSYFENLYIKETIRKNLDEISIDLNKLKKLNWKMKNDENFEEEANHWLAESKKFIKSQGIIATFPCDSSDEFLFIYDCEQTDKEIAKIKFNKLYDDDKKIFFYPSSYIFPKKSGKKDIIAFLISTASVESSKQIELFKRENNMEAAFLAQGLADRCTEDFAKFLHNTLKAKFNVESSNGRRLAPGYPALPISNNKIIYNLLDASKLEITMTNAGQFHPLSTTAAVVFFRNFEH